MYVEKYPYICDINITQKDKGKLDVIELLIYLRDTGLPNEEIKRIEILKTLNQTELFILYEDVCTYSFSFREKYKPSYIKELLRKNQIKGVNLYSEILTSKMKEEDKELLLFFFKGKVG